MRMEKKIDYRICFIVILFLNEHTHILLTAFETPYISAWFICWWLFFLFIILLNNITIFFLLLNIIYYNIATLLEHTHYWYPAGCSVFQKQSMCSKRAFRALFYFAFFLHNRNNLELIKKHKCFREVRIFTEQLIDNCFWARICGWSFWSNLNRIWKIDPIVIKNLKVSFTKVWGFCSRGANL